MPMLKWPRIQRNQRREASEEARAYQQPDALALNAHASHTHTHRCTWRRGCARCMRRCRSSRIILSSCSSRFVVRPRLWCLWMRIVGPNVQEDFVVVAHIEAGLDSDTDV